MYYLQTMKRSWLRIIGAALPWGLAIAACATGSGSPALASAPSPVHARADSVRPPPRYTPADVHFMSGMIAHHAQAVLMGRWAVDTLHGASRAVRALAERIIVAQQDEIAFLERWLRERNEAPMDHQTLMPGMLTAGQLAELNRARGAEFDRLFLQFMIRHHEGAITMVNELLATHGAAQDGLVFRFAADVNADQTTEIDRMRRMLAALPSGGTSP
jgi:uncharacterized protein (DUF305 family)